MTKKLDLPISPVYGSFRMVFDDPFMMNLYPFDLSGIARSFQNIFDSNRFCLFNILFWIPHVIQKLIKTL